MLENPVSTLSTYWRKADHTFSPEHFTGWAREDNYYTQRRRAYGRVAACAATEIPNGRIPHDDRIHKAAGEDMELPPSDAGRVCVRSLNQTDSGCNWLLHN